MRLFHFSDDPDIATFVPRAVRTPAARPMGREWLNGPLIWAIDESHQPLYLFPRDCPRILVWAVAGTTAEDRDRWFEGRSCEIIAHIEWAWFDRMKSEALYRYELPVAAFEALDDAGMWVARGAVRPLRVDTLSDLPFELRLRNVELRVMDNFRALKPVWQTTLHVSGIRLRHAKGWAVERAPSPPA